MNKEKDVKIYPPKDRTFYCPKPEDLISCSGDVCTKLPDPTKDKIVCNNISYNEFDYTENPLDDE
ncbi:hypothetical protein [Clostridium sp.]|uniref:hypothetical protein n=1 Tax=Clostridium sp. TaxID=1506 RepID=UPI00260E0C18|nr:hypothetical protein [Clostridium sp.]